MTKEELNIVNYVIAVINSANKNNYKIFYNLVVFLVDSFDFKKIQHKFTDEETKGYILIDLDFKNIHIQVEYQEEKNLSYILNITKNNK